MRIAIIDLGTNTFNLLIAEATGGSSYNILLSTKEGVKLGEGGINHKTITDAAFQRGIEAIGRHYERMEPYKVDKVMAFATSAIRDAANGRHFTDTLKQRFNLDVSVISGDKEASLIHLGVKQTLTFHDKRYIILDIGGGSNEFIIADDNQIFWKQSFKLGMARLLEKFQPSDPITAEEISAVEKYLHEELEPLFENFDRYKPEIFIGASGSFDSFVRMLANENLLPPLDGATSHIIPQEVYQKLHHKLISSTKEERDQMKGLEPVRRDMIVLATVFVNFVLNKLGLLTIYQSDYSLKEGAVLEFISQS
ncbi:MAG: phosphatase [Bacteroidota bacterium]|nr:phosphatase [Bacteroidota bacterium]